MGGGGGGTRPSPGIEPETLALVFPSKFPKKNNNKINKKVTFRLRKNKFVS